MRSPLRASILPDRATETVIASAAKQSIAPRKERMDCFASLATTTKRAFAASRRDAPEASYPPTGRAFAPDSRLREAIHLAAPSLRAQRSNPSRHAKKEWIASSLRSSQRRRSSFKHAFAGANGLWLVCIGHRQISESRFSPIFVPLRPSFKSPSRVSLGHINSRL